MSLTRKIAHNTIIQAIGKVIGTLFGLVTVALMTRYLGQTGYGQYTTVMTFLQFFGILVDFGLTLLTVQMISRVNVDEEKILSNIFTLRLFSATIFLGLAPITVLFLPYDHVIKLGVAVTAASYVFIALNSVMTGIFQKNLAMNRVAAAEIGNRLILLVMVAMAVWYNWGLLAILIAVVISNAFQFLLHYIYSRPLVKLRFRFDWPVWREIFHLAWPMAITIALNLIYLRADTLVLSLTRPQADVGIFGAVDKVNDILITLPIMFAGLVLPVLTQAWHQKDTTRFKRVFQKSFDTLSIIAIPLVAGTWLMSRDVMVLVAGKNFAISGSVLNIMILTSFVIYLGSLFGHAIVAINRQKQTIWGYAGSAILSTIGFLIFIPKYSYFGAAWMSVFSEAIVSASIIFIFYQTTKFLPTTKIWLKAAVSAAAMALVLIFMKQFIVTPFLLVNVIVWLSVSILTYFATLIAIKGVSMETISEIARLP